MKRLKKDRQMLAEYLLGRLNESARMNLAERYFADDELFEELSSVENDLLDQYVRGQLDEEDCEGFEQYLKGLPDGKHRIEVARALMQLIPQTRAEARADLGWPQSADQGEAKAVAASPMINAGASRWQSVRSGHTQPPMIRRYVLTYMLVSLVGIIGLGGYAYNANKRLKAHRDELDSVKGQIEKLQSELNVLKAETRSRREPFPSSGDSIIPTTSEENIVEMTLSLNDRGGRQTPIRSVFLKSNIEKVKLIVLMNKKESYPRPEQAAYLEPEGSGGRIPEFGTVAESKEREKYGKAVIFHFNARLLSQGKYRLVVPLADFNGIFEAKDYVFNVVRE